MSPKWKEALACCLLAAAGCSAEQPDMEKAKQVAADGDIEQLAADSRDLAAQAAEVLAEELNVPISTIVVDSVRAVEWRDSSIGCPQPDEAYMQVITPGNKITLRHDGKLYFVHEAGGRAFVCKRRKAVSGPAAQFNLDWGKMALEARRDLADRLGVAEDAIIIGSAEGMTFTETSLGCPEPGVEYETRYADGYVLTLRHGSRNYTYHTDLERVIPCPAITVD